MPACGRCRGAGGARAEYPCVLKPLGLSASRGVIRANNALRIRGGLPPRIAKIGELELQVEGYIPGREFAVEGMITGGKLAAHRHFRQARSMEGPFSKRRSTSRRRAAGERSGGADRDDGEGSGGRRAAGTGP